MVSKSILPPGVNSLDASARGFLDGHSPNYSATWLPPLDEIELIQIAVNDANAARAVSRLVKPLMRFHFSDAICGAIFGAISTVNAREEVSPQSIAKELDAQAQDDLTPDPELCREALYALRQIADKVPAAITEHPQDFAKKRACKLASKLQADYEAGLKPLEADPEIAPFEFSTDENLDDKLTGIEWLWPSKDGTSGYIPRGFITGLVGDQEQGKSMIAQNFCDIVLRGVRWPDGTSHTPTPDTKLLWIDTEGSIALFHDRLKAWKMPRGRFILPPDPLQELTIDDALSWLWIEKAIEKFSPPLIVIDALSGAHKGRENGNDEMKPVMKKLAELAQRFHIAVVVIHHLGKPAPGVPLYPITIHRLRGASAISQYCRSILALSAPDAAQPEARRLDVIKLNLARKPAPVGYILTNNGPAWGNAPEPQKERRVVDDAKDFLELALAEGPRESKELESEAKEQGIGRNALHDAKKSLNIKAQREGGKDGRWFWYPSQYATVADGALEGDS
jgi:hypothetical protein